MDNHHVPFFVSFFFLLSAVHSKKSCPISYCANNSFYIQYPFMLQDQQPQNCSYTTLKCKPQGKVILNLPNSGDFYVRDIDYESSAIQLYDPGNCLPRRLMSLNLSSANPLVAAIGQNYTFYTCPPEVIQISNLTSIDCLSNSSIATVATYTISSQVMSILYRCNEIATAFVPSTWPHSDFLKNPSDFILAWKALPCENCPENTTGRPVPFSVLGVAILMVYLLTIVWPAIMCIACCVHFTKLFQKESPQ